MLSSIRRHWLLVSIGSCLAVILIAFLGIRTYVNSERVRSLLATKLTAVLGTSVEVDQVNVGWNSSGVKIRVFEAGDSKENSQLLVTAENAEAEISLPQLIRGETPQQLRLHRVWLQLRLDEHGNLLTRLPQSQSHGGAMPSISVDDASVVIRQTDRPDFQLGGINGTLTSEADQLTASLSVRDPEWGRWSGEGTWDTATNLGSFVVHSDSLQLTQDRLISLPGVPKVIWQQLHAAGEMATELRVSRAAADQAVQTRVRLTPKAASVKITSIGLELEDVNGSIEIDNAVVHLRGMRATAANGSVEASGKLDFTPTPSVLQFHVAANRLDLRRLPPSWAIPPKLEGYLKGSADIELLVDDEIVQTRGQGRGEVENARVAGIPAERVELRLTTDGRRFRFNDATSMIPTSILTAICLQPPASPQPTPTFEVSFDFKDVDLADLVQRMELKIPIALAGRVSLSAKARLPLNQVSDPRAYRLTGKTNASRLSIEHVDFENVKADLILRDGVLSLTNLTGAIPKLEISDMAAGTVSGQARAELFPLKDLSAEMAIERLPLAIVPRSLGMALEGNRGMLRRSLKVSLSDRKPSRPSDLECECGSGQQSTRTIRPFGELGASGRQYL